MNKPKIQFGAIKLNIGKPKKSEENKDEPTTSGKFMNFFQIYNSKRLQLFIL
jgi:hypothetical protein